MGTGIIEVTELSVAGFIEAALADGGLYARHHVEPHGHLRTIEWRLLDNGLCTIGHIAKDDVVSLVGCVAEEIALENGCGPLVFSLEGCAGIQYGLQLLRIGQLWRTDVDDGMHLPHFRAIVKA